jgi:hypothetical protein
MARSLQTQTNSLYGSPQGLSDQFPSPVVAQRDPTTLDVGYSLGQEWVNTVDQTVFFLAGVSGGIATWNGTSGEGANILADSFTTSSPTLGTEFTANTITPIGSNANINLVLNAKGSGTVGPNASDPGGPVTLSVTNTSNTPNSAAILNATVGGTSAGDAYTTYTITGNAVWSSGLENISRNYVISNTASLESGQLLVVDPAGDVTATGNIVSSTAGKGLQIKSGSNARIGTGTFVAGSVGVLNTSITANTAIFLTTVIPGGTVGVPFVASKTIGTGFSVNSTSALDTSTFDYLLIEAN